MKKILIAVNAVVFNRGSEALIRGISRICKSAVPDCEITLVSSEESFSEKVAIDNIDHYIKKKNQAEGSLFDYAARGFRKLKMTAASNHFFYSKLKALVKEQDLVFLIGADNFDISYNMQEDFYNYHSYLIKGSNAQFILYDCSFDKRDITDTLVAELEQFDAITVRETVSQKNIEGLVPPEKLMLFPDPAFVMDCEETELPDIFARGDVIGINSSNLITHEAYSNSADTITEAYKRLVTYILDTTDCGVALIPHVMQGADLKTLKVIYDDFKGNDRVFLLDNENLNARQLKYIISKCRLYVGARTHSTIAAYSSYVPTLVLGYSVKSVGIANDLFGTDSNYVLPVSKIDTTDYLVNGFKWLMDNEESIRAQLHKVMPSYIEKAYSIGNTIARMTGELK